MDQYPPRNTDCSSLVAPLCFACFECFSPPHVPDVGQQVALGWSEATQRIRLCGPQLHLSRGLLRPRAVFLGCICGRLLTVVVNIGSKGCFVDLMLPLIDCSLNDGTKIFRGVVQSQLKDVSPQCWLRLGRQFLMSLAAIFSPTLGIHLTQGHACHSRALADGQHYTQRYRAAAVLRFLPSLLHHSLPYRGSDSSVALKRCWEGWNSVRWPSHSSKFWNTVSGHLVDTTRPESFSPLGNFRMVD